MALVDYISQDTLPYSTTIVPSGRPSVTVMGDSSIRGRVGISEDTVRLRVVHRPIATDNLHTVRDWIRANRNNSIRIIGSDLREYIGEFERDGYQAKALSANHHEISFDLLAGVNVRPSTTIDVNAEVIGNLAVRFSWGKPEIRSGRFRRYLVQWRINEDDWSEAQQRYIENIDTLSYATTGQLGQVWHFRVRTEAEIREDVIEPWRTSPRMDVGRFRLDFARFSWPRAEVGEGGVFYGYRLQWRMDNQPWSSQRETFFRDINQLNTQFQVRTPQTWQFRVRAEYQTVNNEVVSDWSANAFVTIVQTPPKLENFTRQIVNDIAILTWDPLPDKTGFLGYEVEQRLGARGDWIVVQTTIEEQVSINMFDTRGQRHRWRVRARSLVGFGTYSEVLSYRHPLNPPFTVGTRDNPIIIRDPKNYSNVEVSSLLRRAGFGLENGTFFRFTVPSNEREPRYRILVRGAPTTSNWDIAEADGDPIATGSTINEQLTFQVTPGENYDFVVYPYDLAATRTVQSMRLTIIDFVQDAPHPLSLRTENVTQLRIPLTWNAPRKNNSDLIEYQIQISTNPREFWTTVSIGRLSTFLTVTEFIRNEGEDPIKIAANNRYYFRGRTRNGIGWSAWSDTLEVRTPSFSRLEGRWEIGKVGRDAGIISSYRTPGGETVTIPQDTWVTQFVITSLGGYTAAQTDIDSNVRGNSVVLWARHETTGAIAAGWATSSDSMRRFIPVVDYHFPKNQTVDPRYTEGDVAFFFVYKREPTTSRTIDVSFSCSNPSGARGFRFEQVYDGSEPPDRTETDI